MRLQAQERIAHTSNVQHEITMPYEALQGQVWPGEESMLDQKKMLAAHCQHADKIISYN